MSTKLWTGKTARQELVSSMAITAAVGGYTVSIALEVVLDGAEKLPDGSIKREILRYWDGLSGDGQARLLREIRSKVRSDDRLMGRQVAR